LNTQPEQLGGRLSPQLTRDQARSSRDESPAASMLSISSRDRTKGPSASPNLQRDINQNQVDEVGSTGAAAGASLFHSTKERWMPVEAKPEYSPRAQVVPGEFGESPDLRSEQKPGEMGQPGFQEPTPIPERKRPPMASRDNSVTQSYDEELRPPPLSMNRAASGQRPETPRSPHTASDRMPGGFYETPQASTTNLGNTVLPAQRQQSPIRKTEKIEETKKLEPEVDGGVSPSIRSLSEAGTPDTEKDEDEAHRPGLGPMIKKRAVADRFRKAATAASAFKPRAGSAVERLKKPGVDTNEPDGINSVVPAPLRAGSIPTPSAEIANPSSKDAATPTIDVQGPAGTVSNGALNNGVQLTDAAMSPAVGYEEADGAKSVSEEGKQVAIAERKPKRRSPQQEKYLESLGIDPKILEGKGLDFETTLSDFGWGSIILQPKHIENIEGSLKREIGRVEAGSWLGHLEQKDDRVEMVDKMLDRAIAECEELDGLLTLYSVELSTLNDDIAFIEAQSQGLQVQTANQKILHTELQNLVNMISLTPEQLEPVERGSFEEDLEEMEASLVLLYNAMLTIDPNIKSVVPLEGEDNPGKAELATMAALQEKRDIYLGESSLFCQRLISWLSKVFDAYLNESIPALVNSPVGKPATTNLHPQACNAARTFLWQYSPVILFTKEVDRPAWRQLLEIYMADARPCYASVFRGAMETHRKSVRAPTGDEADVLFTSMEKEHLDGLAGTTRKLTMKRSQTMAKAVRSASGEKAKMLQSGRHMPCEAFADMLGEWAPVLAMEQNFIVELFHATTLENIDFADAVNMYPPEQRRGPPDLMIPKLMEPDRSLAEYVTRATGYIFDFWPAELRSTIEQSIAVDQL